MNKQRPASFATKFFPFMDFAATIVSDSFVTIAVTSNKTPTKQPKNQLVNMIWPPLQSHL